MLNAYIETHGGTIPLAQLSELIGYRQQVLKESLRDAVVACAIDALVSIRAATRKAKPSAPTNPEITLAPEYVPSVHVDEEQLPTSWLVGCVRANVRRIPCLRDPSGKRIKPPHSVRWVSPRAKFRQLHVFRVKPEHERDRPWLAVARNQSDALRAENERSKRRKQQHGGLARVALSLCMKSLSTKNVPQDNVTEESEKLGTKFSDVQHVIEQNGEYGLHITDHLEYARLALQGGQGAVDDAIKRACNKVAGLLMHYQSQKGLSVLPAQFGTPFPEVMRRR